MVAVSAAGAVDLAAEAVGLEAVGADAEAVVAEEQEGSAVRAVAMDNAARVVPLNSATGADLRPFTA